MVFIYSEKCRYCLQDVCNGIGADDTPRLNKFLQKLHSSHLFYNASVGHDLRYHNFGDNEIGRKFSDERFLEDMLEICNAKSIYTRWFWKIQAYRNYWFVRKFGSKFYNMEGCPNKKELRLNP